MKFALPARLLRALAAVGCSVGLLASCGGGTSHYDKFVPSRLIVFGDEYSALVDPNNSGNGDHYAMNALNSLDTTNATVLCSDSSRYNWVQRLASYYGLTFKECNPNNLASSRLNALMQARYGATERAVEAQFSDFQGDIGHDALGSNDLVTVWVGMNDVIEIYKDSVTYSSTADKTSEATARGEKLGRLINTITDTGARVLVAQVFEMGATPWAKQQGSSEAKLMTSLSDAFNQGLRTTLLNDGSKIGLLTFNDSVANLVQYGNYETTEAACDDAHVADIDNATADSDGYLGGAASLSTCTTATVPNDNAAKKDLWVDGIHLNAYIAHSTLGSLAITRATSNPF
ncbi:SGNH/GDSL hydrolase family protein [Ideonella oryzae]|uniref:SGNH/GDSL hydrolase family protein n=1 Tax=Ideonella oryzae TaxID=2937441 RepID=A0ABT1BLM1_9BURK|nr:SGNH/GDSL hydrolase family protein [Ideonella oryzae]MCO5977121.1 SGNH/GDSL hydrolase family protein [Ideonella oryzae]